MFKAIIFDVDGTLSETEEIHREAFNHAFEAQGLAWRWDRVVYRELLKTTGGKERIRRFIGEHEPDRLQDRDLDHFIRDLHATKTKAYMQMVGNGDAELRPGIRRVIEQAIDNGIRLAIATTTSLPNVEALLQSAYGNAGIKMFEVLSCGDSVPKKKPAPDIFLLALKQLGLASNDCVAIEDSRNGLLSSTGAGIPTVVTPSVYTDDQNFDAAALVIDTVSFASLEAVYELAKRKSATKSA